MTAGIMKGRDTCSQVGVDRPFNPSKDTKSEKEISPVGMVTPDVALAQLLACLHK